MAFRGRNFIPRVDKKKKTRTNKHYSVRFLSIVIKKHTMLFCVFPIESALYTYSGKVEMAKLSSAGEVNTCVLCSVLKALYFAVK